MTRRDLLLLIAAFLLSRGAVTAAGVLAMRVLSSNESDQFTHLLDGGTLTPAVDMWYRWDAGFYTSIATYGYDWVNDHQPASDMAFLPVYPLAVHLVSGMTANGCALSPYLSTCATLGGLAVSNAALLASVLLLFMLAERRYSRAAAWRAALLLLVSPISIFLSAPYTESLFLLLSLLVFWLLERERFALAVLAACIAALTRSVGAALFLPLAWYAWRGGSNLLTPPPSSPRLQGGEQNDDIAFAPSPEVGGGSGRGSSPIRIVLAFIPPLLFAGYILLAGVSVGDLLAYFKTYDAVWGRAAGTPIQAFTVYFSGQDVSWFGWRLSWLDLIMTLVYLALAALLIADADTRAYGLFALFALLIPIASGTLIGMPRFGAVIFPFYLLLGRWANRPPKMALVYGASGALALLFIARFVTWRWIA